MTKEEFIKKYKWCDIDLDKGTMKVTKKLPKAIRDFDPFANMQDMMGPVPEGLTFYMDFVSKPKLPKSKTVDPEEI